MSTTTTNPAEADLDRSAAEEEAHDERFFVETIEMFVPHARGAVMELVRHVGAMSGADGDAASGRVRAGLSELAAQFSALHSTGAARLCRATAAAIERGAGAGRIPFDTVLESLTQLSRHVEVLAADPGARWRDPGDLLARLIGDGARPLDCGIGGEYADAADDFVSGLRDQLAGLSGALSTGRLPGASELADAVAAARGVAGVAAMLDLTPLVDLARDTETVLLHRTLDWPAVETLSDAVGFMRQVLDGLGGGTIPTVGQLEAHIAAIDRVLDAPAESDAPVAPAEPEVPAARVAAAEPVACRFLTVVVDSQLYGIEAERVGEVVARTDPAAANAQLVDLRSRPIDAPEPGADDPGCVVLVDAGDDGIRAGVLVDAVRDEVEITAEQFEELEHGDCIPGAARLENGVLRLLDLDRVLAHLESAS